MSVIIRLLWGHVVDEFPIIILLFKDRLSARIDFDRIFYNCCFLFNIKTYVLTQYYRLFNEEIFV